MRLTLLVSLLVAAWLTACATAGDHRIVSLDRGTLLYAGETEAIEVTLPQTWWAQTRSEHKSGTYRLHFHLEREPLDLWAVYLPRLSMNAAVSVNGHFIGDGGTRDAPISRNANRPLYFSIPTGMLTTGDNAIEVELFTVPSFPGYLDPVLVGPDASLRPRFDLRYLLQITLSQVIALTCVALALLILGLYARRDENTANSWFAVALLLWAIPLTGSFLRDPPAPARLWEWLGIASLAGVVYCLIRAFHVALLPERPVGRERLALGLLLGPGIATAVVPTPYAFAARVFWHVTVGIVGIYVVILVLRIGRSGASRNPRTLALGVGMVGLLAAHDIASIFVSQPLIGFWLSGYAASVALLITGASILGKLSDSLTEAESLNLELEGRVRQKHEELEENYQRLRTLERERAVTSERERIMQDVHDGIGGQLVSTLALVESGRGDPDVVADSLHEALDDLRLIIDSLDPDEGDLAAALGTMRLRLQPRLERNGIEVDWKVQDVPPIEGFGPEQALQVLRVVQEAIANVLKHAGATRVGIQTGTSDEESRPTAYVEVDDDGCGMNDEAPPGRGLANMRRRAAALGGTLQVRSDGHGTRVRLRLPLADDGSAVEEING